MNPLKLLLILLFCNVALADGVTLPATERIELDNGAVLILSEKHDVPLIGVEAVVRGGAIADPADKHGLASLLADMLLKGAGDRDAATLVEAAAAVGGNLSTSADRETISVSAEFLAKDAALMVELVADVLQRPTLSRSEFDKLRERSINLIAAAKGGDPRNLIAPYANAFLFGEHPYGNPLGGSEASLAAITHADLRRFYADHVGADRLVIAVSGDFEAAQMRTMLEDAFGEWRTAAAELPVIEQPTPATGGRVYLVDKPGATQSYFNLGNIGVAREFPQRASLDLANTVFGGRFTSMLNTELRTKSGLSYGAGSRLSRYAAGGSWFISSYTATETTQEAIDLALSTLAQLRDIGVSDAMRTSAQQYVIGQMAPDYETAAQLAEAFAYLESAGLDVSHVNDYDEALAAATPESIRQVIDKIYQPASELVFVIIGDADSIREQVSKYGEVTEVSIAKPSFHP